MNVLLKQPIKWERKCAGAGFHLQKYLCKVGGMDVLGAVHKLLPSAAFDFFSLCCGLQLQTGEK